MTRRLVIGCVVLITLIVLIVFIKSKKPQSSQVSVDLIPTTHTWYSSFLYSPFSKDIAVPFFALPNSYRVIDDGIEMGSPRVSFSEKTIYGSHLKDLLIRFDGGGKILSKNLTISGDWNVEAVLDGMDGKTLTVNFTKGSPILTLHSESNLEIGSIFKDIQKLDSDTFGIVTQNNNYIVISSHVIAFDKEHLTISGSPDSLQIITLPSELPPSFESVNKIANCLTPLETTRMDWKFSKTSLFITFDFLPSGFTNKFLFVLPPHMKNKINGSYEILGTYDSPRGKLELVCGKNLEIEITRVHLKDSFREFIQNTKIVDPKTEDLFLTDYAALINESEPAGVYFKGKYIKNLIDLWEIAGYLDKDDQRQQLENKIKPILLSQISKFSLDESSELVFHSNPEFGSETGNDHHFQYGYYISSYARFYDEFSSEEKPMVDSLIQKFVKEGIPGYFKNSQYPLTFRFLDLYEGHSWADAKAKFADGNNQESSSEALYYWYSLWLWSQKTSDVKLQDLSELAFTIELQGTQKYWWLMDNASITDKFHKPVISLIWGGKSDYATWFSAEDDKILGIQILPLNPSSFVSLDFSSNPQDFTRITQYYESYFQKNSNANFLNYYNFLKIINKSPITNNISPTNEFVPLSLLYLLQNK